VDILVAGFPWAEAFQLRVPPNRRSTLAALRNQNSWKLTISCQRYADAIFSSGTRVSCSGQHPFSRQHECNSFGEKWQIFQRQENKTYQHSLFSFICDRVSNGELTLEWCSTTEMVGDFMTKRLISKISRHHHWSSLYRRHNNASEHIVLVPQERGPHRSVLAIRKVRSHKSSPA
jgi:hypothetical protein